MVLEDKVKSILVAVIVLLIASCSPFGLNPMGYEILHEDLDTAWRKVSAMEYQTETTPYVKSPTEFFATGGGDCDDFVAALVYLLGPESSGLSISYPFPNHCIVKYRGMHMEPQVYNMYYSENDIVITGEYTYYEIMIPSTRWGTKGL